MSLLTAVRDVAKTLSDLFDLTCTASRKMRVSDPTKEQLKMSTEVHVCFMHVRGCTIAIVEAVVSMITALTSSLQLRLTSVKRNRVVLAGIFPLSPFHLNKVENKPIHIMYYHNLV